MNEEVDAFLERVYVSLEPGRIYDLLKQTLNRLPIDVIDELQRKIHSIEGFSSFGRVINVFATHTKVIVVLDEERLSFFPDELIVGVLAHEFAHVYLDHSLKTGNPHFLEQEANELVIKWGFEKEIKVLKEFEKSFFSPKQS